MAATLPELFAIVGISLTGIMSKPASDGECEGMRAFIILLNPFPFCAEGIPSRRVPERGAGRQQKAGVPIRHIRPANRNTRMRVARRRMADYVSDGYELSRLDKG
jgi:hypothetical protein